jgi:hypothetical protein
MKALLKAKHKLILRAGVTYSSVSASRSIERLITVIERR